MAVPEGQSGPGPDLKWVPSGREEGKGQPGPDQAQKAAPVYRSGTSAQGLAWLSLRDSLAQGQT